MIPKIEGPTKTCRLIELALITLGPLSFAELLDIVDAHPAYLSMQMSSYMHTGKVREQAGKFVWAKNLPESVAAL